MNAVEADEADRERQEAINIAKQLFEENKSLKRQSY